MQQLSVGVVLTLVLVSAAIYFATGANQGAPSTQVSAPVVTRSDAGSGAKDGTALGSVQSMVGGLEERLQQQPDDGKGWLLLAKSYRHMGRLEEARLAYGKADALGNGDATVAAQLFGLNTGTVNAVMEAQLEDMEMSQ